MQPFKFNCKSLSGSLLWVFPIMLTGISLFFLSQMLPVYIGADGYDMDPTYVYLSNSLLLLHGSVPQYYDHPGIPLQIWSALIILSRWVVLKILGDDVDGLYADVVTHPEPYIALISISLACINGLANYYLGRRVYLATNKYGLALLVQSFLFSYSAFLPRATHFAAESFLIAGSMLLIGKLTPFIFNHEQLKSQFTQSDVKLAGVIAGFGFAVKMNFLPMLALLLLLDDKKNIVKAYLWCIGSYLLFLLPVVTRFGNILGWIADIVQHSGRHGGGADKWIEFDQIYLRMHQLVDAFPLVYIAAFLLLLFIVRFTVSLFGFREKSLMNIKVPLIILCIIGVESALVIKHPGNHYMIPVLPLTFIAISWLLLKLRGSVWHRRLQDSFIFVLLLSTFFMAKISVTSAYVDLQSSHLAQLKSYEQVSNYLGKYPQKLVIGTFRCNLPQCAIAFGGQWAYQLGKYYDQPLANFGLIHTWEGQTHIKIRRPGEKGFTLAELRKMTPEETPIFLLTPVLYPELSKFDKELVMKTSTQYLFRVKKL